MGWSWLGREVTVVVEAPAGSFVKRDAAGRVDVVSPLPVPWNYGRIEGAVGGDGDPLDALLLGPRRAAGAVVVGRVCGVVRFVDGGEVDDKLVVGTPGRWTPEAVQAFFAAYTVLKRALARVRGGTGATGVVAVGWMTRRGGIRERRTDR